MRSDLVWIQFSTVNGWAVWFRITCQCSSSIANDSFISPCNTDLIYYVVLVLLQTSCNITRIQTEHYEYRMSLNTHVVMKPIIDGYMGVTLYSVVMEPAKSMPLNWSIRYVIVIMMTVLTSCLLYYILYAHSAGWLSSFCDRIPTMLSSYNKSC